MDLERLTTLLSALSGRWPQVLAVFGGMALAAGLLGMITRALGVKEDDGLRGLRSKGNGPSV